jgi:putative transposase
LRLDRDQPKAPLSETKANLRILEIDEVKIVPYTPISHPFVERLIASIRREFLDQTLFWTATDLQRKLLGYQQYFNHHRTHSGLDGAIPVCTEAMAINLNDFRWQRHCRGLFEPPVAP